MRLLNPQDGSDFSNGQIVVEAQLHPSAIGLTNFDATIHGNLLNQGTDCGTYLSSEPVGVFTSPLDTTSFNPLVIPLTEFARRNLTALDLVFGVNGTGAVPNSPLIIISEIRWEANSN